MDPYYQQQQAYYGQHPQQQAGYGQQPQYGQPQQQAAYGQVGGLWLCSSLGWVECIVHASLGVAPVVVWRRGSIT